MTFRSPYLERRTGKRTETAGCAVARGDVRGQGVLALEHGRATKRWITGHRLAAGVYLIVALFPLTLTLVCLGCGPALPEPNLVIVSVEPDAALRVMGQQWDHSCSQADLTLPEPLAVWTGQLPPLVAPDSGGPRVSSCQQIESWCAQTELLKGHAIEPSSVGAESLCLLAEQCKTADSQLAAVSNAFREDPIVVTVLDSERDSALERFLKGYLADHPQADSLLRDYSSAGERRRSILCRAFPTYLAVSARTGASMLTGHREADEYISSILVSIPQDFADVVYQFTPPTDSYEHMVNAYIMYTALAEGGGFVALPSRCARLKPGDTGPDVVLLRQRLAQEKLVADQTTAVYDPALGAAVRSFHWMHGLEPSDRMSEAVVRLMAMPASEKALQMARALRVHREAVPPWEASFIHVQSPQAIAELYLDGEYVVLHRTVLGSPRIDLHPIKNRRERIYRTPQLDSMITSIIFNPEWKVPESIAQKEIIPKAMEDPSYLENHNYRVITYSDGSSLYVQKSGPGNALGRVKFQFANPYGVYLHDTPNKQLFGRRIRLASHGCVRVENARDLALTILAHDQGTSAADVQSWLGTRRTREVFLKTPIPIHITYSTAGADSLGRVYFLQDYYHIYD